MRLWPAPRRKSAYVCQPRDCGGERRATHCVGSSVSASRTADEQRNGRPRASALAAAARATTLWYSPPRRPRPDEPVRLRPPRPSRDQPRCLGPPARVVFPRSHAASLISRTASSSPASRCRPASTQPGRVSGTRAPIWTDGPSVRFAPGGDGGVFIRRRLPCDDSLAVRPDRRVARPGGRRSSHLAVAGVPR